jgi:hypothetical protein
MVLLQLTWRRESKDSRGQGLKGLFSKDFISAVNILSISAMSFLSVTNSLFSIKSKFPANKIWVPFLEYFFAFRSNPWTLDPLDRSAGFKAFHSNPWILDPLTPLGSHLLKWR